MEHSNKYPLWQQRFGREDKVYFGNLSEMLEEDILREELVNEFPIYTGHVNLSHYIALYESYKKVSGLSGHYADVGVYKGSSLLFIAKLIKIFEDKTMTQAHGFDWFNGMDNGSYTADYDRLINLINIQKLSNIAVIHRLDLTKDLPQMDKEYPWLTFKYVYMDCGSKDVLDKAIPFFWNRLVPGGVFLFDHFAADIQDETKLAIKYLPNGVKFRQFPFTRQPTACVIKGE